MNILVVADSPNPLLSLRAELQVQGFVAYFAAGLEEAVARLNEQDVCAVLMIVENPDDNGTQAFDQLQARAQGAPIVILSVHDDRALALQFVSKGAHDYLVFGTAHDTSVVRSLQFAVERTKADSARQRGDRRLRVILDNSYSAFVSMDSQWRITDWNTKAEQTFGWSRQQALGQSLGFIMPSHLRRQNLSNIKKHFVSSAETLLNTSKELLAVRCDGTEFPIEIVIFRIKADSDYMFCAFARDITESRRSNEQLELLVHERTERLTQSNDELRQFAKIASHDLQEPLRAIQGFATLLAQSTEGKLEKDASEFIDYILDGTFRMKELIQSVLAHSQIEKDDTIEHDTDCNSVVAEVLSYLTSSTKESGTNLEIDTLPHVAVERTQLIQLFQNLISNAIKYRGAEPLTISITAERQSHQWLFSVRDNGLGIDEKYSDKIFDMFSRLNSKAAFPGTGMGLAICKKIVLLHGGRIWVESALGVGSIFLFTLPAIKHTRRAKMKDTIEILLVEDTPSDVRLTEEALKRSALTYTMHVVCDGVVAMEHLEQLKETHKRLPDVILLDLNMPRKNGHQVLEEIKNDPALKEIPVVLLTVSERDEDVMEALKLKMNYYVAKPVTPEKISILLRLIYELHNREKQSGEVGNEETHIRMVLAGNPHTSPIALARLAEDPQAKIRGRVAQHLNVPSEVLEKLAGDLAAEVRIGVSENPHAPLSVLEILTSDSCDDVRLELASNSHLSEHLLEILAKDSHVYVAAAAQATLLAKAKSSEQAKANTITA